jgi:hypothetical protein
VVRAWLQSINRAIKQSFLARVLGREVDARGCGHRGVPKADGGAGCIDQIRPSGFGLGGQEGPRRHPNRLRDGAVNLKN